jgi:predicted RNA-binding Zn ribbon-like protein
MTPPVPRSPRAPKPDLNTEDLAIRFVNTVAWRLRKPVEERLSSPSALLDWLLANAIGDAEEIKVIARFWKKRPDVAAAICETAIRLREAIYEVLTARIRGEDPSRNALAIFNAVLSQPSPALRVGRPRGELSWRRRSIEGDGSDLLMPIAFSAVELMTGVRAANAVADGYSSMRAAHRTAAGAPWAIAETGPRHIDTMSGRVGVRGREIGRRSSPRRNSNLPHVAGPSHRQERWSS